MANAVLDGTDAVMLSGETAIGAYPIVSVRMIGKIIDAVEQSPEAFVGPQHEAPPLADGSQLSIPDAIGAAVAAIVHALPVKVICVLTATGSSARLVARHRPGVPILAFTFQETTFRRLSLLWGVRPIMTEYAADEITYYRKVDHALQALGLASPGDTVLVTGGHPIGRGGPTNLLKIMTVGETRTPSEFEEGQP